MKLIEGFTKRELIIIAIAFGVLGILIGAGFYYRRNLPIIPSSEEAPLSLPEKSVEELKENKYTSEVPKGAVETKPQKEAPAAPNVTAKLGLYELSMTRSGFSPASVTVKKGNLATISITAVDADYDVKIPYMEMWVTIKKGEKKSLSFQTNTSGTFLFECDTLCPAGGRVQGSLIVLP